MAAGFRAASERDVKALWPVVNASHQFDGEAEYRARLAAAPWTLRVDDAGDAALVERWRDHLDFLHVRAAWCNWRKIPELVDDVRALAIEHGFDQVLSPILDESAIRPYLGCGMDVRERLVLMRARSHDVRPGSPPAGVVLREGTEDDLESVVTLERLCFDPFWQSGYRMMADRLRRNRLVVATLGDEVIGYTLTTLSRDAGSLGSLAVHPSARRRGVGHALVAESAAYLSARGAREMTLCTQERNTPSRAMYRKTGLVEAKGRLVFASGRSGRS